MIRRLAPFSLALCLAASLAACDSGRAGGAADAATPQLSRVTADRSDLLFRYKKGEAIESATTIAEIPAEARQAVQVVDLALPPEARGSTAFVQVFDLSQPGADGTFPGRLVPRNALEGELRKAAATPAQAPVTMYSAAWCGVCKKAKEFMRAQGIAFVEKDIEKDTAAAAEIGRKAQAAGVSASGVPIFDVGGRILGGFDPDTLLAAARPTPQP
jgi:glutaredoxin